MATLSRLRIAAQPLRRFFSRSRDYRSAAARRLDYDSDDYFDDDDDKSLVKGKNGLEKEGSDGCVPGRGVQWVIIGDPMAKRHVYAERLSKLLGVPHISMGTLVRQELHPHSSLYKQVGLIFLYYRVRSIIFSVHCIFPFRWIFFLLKEEEEEEKIVLIEGGILKLKLFSKILLNEEIWLFNENQQDIFLPLSSRHIVLNWNLSSL